jgi:hypothetical protein
VDVAAAAGGGGGAAPTPTFDWSVLHVVRHTKGFRGDGHYNAVVMQQVQLACRVEGVCFAEDT